MSTEKELPRCPVCTSAVTLTLPEGRFVICATCDQAWNADTYNDLARRAEIGALVERIVENIEYIPDDGRLFVGHGGLSVGIEDDFGEHRHVAAASLLDALRALAKEMNGE